MALITREQKIQRKLAALGIKPGISHEQVEDATALLVRERQMWSRFHGFTAQALFQFEDQRGKSVSFAGQVVLLRSLPSRAPNRRCLAHFG